MSAGNRFRILHCLRAPVGGLFRHVCDLAIAQSAAGHEVAVVSADGGNALTEERLAALSRSVSGGVHRIASSRNPGFADIAATRRVIGLARHLGSDVLHGHGAKGGAYARIAAARLRGPIALYTPHGGSLHYAATSLSGRAVRLIERRLETLGHGLIFESQFAADRYAGALGAPRVPARVIANGVGAADFEPVTPAADATDVLFVGELRHLKGVDVLIEALALVAARRPVTATIVGAGPDEAAFRALVRERNLDALVRFTGALPARQAFTMGRLIVMPSRAESLPYIALEAGAAGVPLLATRVGGMGEIVGDTGVPLVPPGDAEALAMRLLEATDDHTAITSQTAALRARIRARFSVASMAAGVEAFYHDLVALEASKVEPGRLAIAAE